MADGVTGCAFITIVADNPEVQPDAFVTVKLYEPVARFEIVLLVPVPEMFPGLIVQLPAGKSFKVTLPVDVEQVGCVMVPTVGAEGITG